MYTVGIITVSDKIALGKKEDIIGPLIAQTMRTAGYDVKQTLVVSGEQSLLAAALVDFADNQKFSLILTTGGTGFAPRDVTPEATLSVIKKQTPGISEAMRAQRTGGTPNAMLSRGVSGIRGKSLIINLPGSPKAVSQCLAFIMDPLARGLDILHSKVNAVRA